MTTTTEQATDAIEQLAVQLGYDPTQMSYTDWRIVEKVVKEVLHAKVKLAWKRLPWEAQQQLQKGRENGSKL